MATIYDQPPRIRIITEQFNLDAIIDAMNAAIRLSTDYTHVDTLSNMEALEVVKFAFHVSDRDVHDEQMSGIAKCLDKLTEKK